MILIYYNNWALDGDFICYGLASWPSWSVWMIPGTDI